MERQARGTPHPTTSSRSPSHPGDLYWIPPLSLLSRSPRLVPRHPTIPTRPLPLRHPPHPRRPLLAAPPPATAPRPPDSRIQENARRAVESHLMCDIVREIYRLKSNNNRAGQASIKDFF